MAQVQLPSLCTQRSDFFKSVQLVATLHESTAFLSKQSIFDKNEAQQERQIKSNPNNTPTIWCKHHNNWGLFSMPSQAIPKSNLSVHQPHHKEALRCIVLRS